MAKRPPPARALAVLASARRSCSGERTFLPLSIFACKEGHRGMGCTGEGGYAMMSFMVGKTGRGRMKVAELISIFTPKTMVSAPYAQGEALSLNNSI